MLKKETNKQRNARRNRYKLKQVSSIPVRLSVHKSNKNVYAQLIDDVEGKTLATISTVGDKGQSRNVDAAAKIGKDIAAAAKKAGVSEVVFDRGAFQYHGVVKAVADGAREGGLKF